jgi:asparagine synthase (glutamine-hydrolysing)
VCGIVAVISLVGEPVDIELVQRMTDALAHRGPDGQGVVAVPGFGHGGDGGGPAVVLGHRRLAILDPTERANQPMTRDHLTVTYNGEIYNYVELRAELEELGYEFTTTSDTEVLLRCYQQWDKACLERLNGIFSFVMCDRRARRVMAVRDRLGVKPLFWAATRHSVMVASEIRALRVAVGRSNLNEGLIYDFLLNGRLDHCDETFFDGIRRVPAGCMLEIEGDTSSVSPYWNLCPNEERYGRSFADNVEEFGGLFRDAVRLQMRSDVPVACCLSGGLDSTAVVSVASMLTPTPMSVFTARYRHPQMDEWRYASALHSERDVKPVSIFAEADEFWADLDDVVMAQEEPFAGPGVFAQWRLMREISSHGIKVTLDGQGGDELLCGYAKYFYFQLADLLRTGHPLRATGAAISALTTGGPQLLNLSGARRYLPGSWWLDRRKVSLLQPGFLARWQDRQVSHPRGTVVDQQVVDLTRLGLPTLLRYEDRNSMAHGVESRVPFLDHRLVEFAMSVPVDHKIRGARSKVLLREALKRTLPELVRNRRSKLGFGGSWHLWVEDLAAELEGWLRRPRLAVDRFVNRDSLRDMLRRRDPSIFHSLVLDRWLDLQERA